MIQKFFSLGNSCYDLTWVKEDRAYLGKESGIV